LDFCSSRYGSFTEPLKLEFAQRIQIYLFIVYIILDSTELRLLCFENRWQPEAVVEAMEVLTHPYYGGTYEYIESDDADVHAAPVEQPPCRRTATCSCER
jgi:hypothetical protein